MVPRNNGQEKKMRGGRGGMKWEYGGKRRREKKGANMRSESILSNGLLLIYSQPFHFIFTRQQSRSIGAIG